MCERNRILTQHDVNKKILDRGPPVHGKRELLNPSARYRDEDYDIYELKKKQFHESVKEYKDLNKMVLASDKVKLDIDGDMSMKFEFLNRIDKPTHSDHFKKGEGFVLRKRTLRPIYGELDNPIDTPKTLEPWFKRYIVMGKFIKVVRSLIVKNRMLKRLEILRTLNPETIEELEEQGFQVYNVSYPLLFQKFITPSKS